MNTTFRCMILASLAILLAACDKGPQSPAPAPAPVSASAAAAATTASAASPAAATAPAATTAAAAGTTAAPAAASDNGPEVAGSVALAQGSVSDTAKDGSVRQLKDGDDVYPGDSFVVGPDSYLDLDLEDGGRMLLRPNTTFQIESYHFEPGAHAETAPTDAAGQPLIKPQQPENAFFRLVKGGLRAIDGLIGHTSPQNYGVETPVATIGVRGTTFDVRYCGDDCQDEADATGAPANGLYTSVDDGSIGVKNDAGETVNKAGDYGYIPTKHVKLQRKDHPPRALRHMRLPEKLKARAEKNRGQIKVRRQQRRQRMWERRRQAAQRAKAQTGPAAATPGKPETKQERRLQRQEQKREKASQKSGAEPSGRKLDQTQDRGRVLRRQEHEEGKQTAAPGPGKPTAAGQGPDQTQQPTPRERRQQLRQERQQLKQQGARPAAKTPLPADKPAQPPEGKQDKRDEARCKAKRRAKKGKDQGNDKGKDKDKCGGE